MRLRQYYELVILPANCAVSAMRRNGLPVDLDRLNAVVGEWERQLVELEREVEAVAASVGTPIKYSDKHAVGQKDLADFLYRGLGLRPTKETKTGWSTDADALDEYASVTRPREGDNPTVYKVLKVRSFQGAIAKALAYRDTRRADGACHPKFNWALRTSRLSAEDPPVHQIPEHSDPDVADAIKSFMVPRVSPAPRPEDWDPRRHGSVVRWDIDGAEAAIRAGMLTKLFCSRPDPAWEYLRLGKDIHAQTAAMVYGGDESMYEKGGPKDFERSVVAKHAFFAFQFGGEASAFQKMVKDQGRLVIPGEQCQRIYDKFFEGHYGLAELYERDKEQAARHGYCEDGYGRRRWVDFPEGAKFLGWGPDGKTRWTIPKGLGAAVARAFHVASNTPTQSMNATDCLWMVALHTHGEYVPLRLPPMWEARGLEWPEAAGWRINGGPGPGGRPFQAWYCNTVHDSGWLDCAPGYLEPLAKLVWRRSRAVPFDWRVEADVPYRVSVQVGPDFGHLRSYKRACDDFGLEPLE